LTHLGLLEPLVVAQEGLVAQLFLEAGIGFLPRAAALYAHGLHLQAEALRLDDIEEQLPNGVRILVAGHLQAGAESQVTAAVGQGVGAVVEEIIAIGHPIDPHLAVVVLPAALVRLGGATQVVVGSIGQVAASAPPRVGCD